ncbi:MAG: hypothetical protein IT361_01705 [Gemmatimonadaceae bacterium]|nr:hypothetical protein [Gemmatimonadaceae bacterium]
MGRNRTISEGVHAGLLGAAVVALWFLVVDVVGGRPMHTPFALGEAVLAVLGLQRGQGMVEVVALYTLIHVVAFTIGGILVAWMVNASDREPSHLAGLFLLFIAFELGFHLCVYALSRRGQFVDIAWYQVGVANVLAAIAMGRYLFRAHPGALHRLDDALAGRT